MQYFFTTEDTMRRADEIIDYLRGPRLWIPQLDYPDYDAWLGKVHTQLKSEDKRALVTIVRGRVAGAVIYQRHLTTPAALEIKNLTVRPDQEGRHVASFMLRNAEIEGAADYGATSVLIDTKTGNSAMHAFLTRQHYLPLATVDLYGLGAGTDAVFRKELHPSAI